MANVNEELRKIIQSKKNQKAMEDAMRAARNEEDRNQILQTISGDLVKSLEPVLGQMAQAPQITKEQIREALDGAFQVSMPEMPEVKLPDINIDTKALEQAVTKAISSVKIPAPTVNVPPSTFQLPERFPVNIDQFDENRPLPVRLYDAGGKPFQMLMPAGSGGGKGDFFTIKGFGTSAFAELTNADGRVKVELPTGSSGLTDTELRASSVPVEQVSGSTWSVAVKEIFGSTITSFLNGDNRIPVSVETGGSALTDAELRASSVPVAQVSGSIWSTEVTNSVTVTGSLTSTGAYLLDGDGAYRGVVPSSIVDPAGNTLDLFKTGDNYVAANDFGVLIYGVVDTTTANYMRPLHMHDTLEDGENDSLVTLSTSGHDKIYDSAAGTWDRVRSNQGYAGPGVMRVVHATDVGVSTNATQSGTWNIGTVTAVTGITNSVAASIIDSSGIQYSGSNPVPTTLAVSNATTSVNVRVVDSGGVGYDGSNAFPVYIAKNATATTSVNVVDSTGVAYSGSNPLPTTSISGVLTSVVAVGDTVSDAADSGSAPVKQGGIARQANPTAVADGDRVSATYDDVGRQVMRPHQVRDLIATAYVSLTTGTETTLLAGTASELHDLIYVMCANQSDAATYVDFRVGTGGAVIKTVQVPASGTAGGSLPVPLKMSEVAQAWTADMPDLTGTTIDITALFVKEV